MSPSCNILAIVPPPPTPSKFPAEQFDGGQDLASREHAADGSKANVKLLVTES